MRCYGAYLSIIIALFVVGLRSPYPTSNHESTDGDMDYLSDREFRSIRDTWITFFVKFDPKVAKRHLTEDFHLYFESLKSIQEALLPKQCVFFLYIHLTSLSFFVLLY
jgi:hypothetical protein